MPGDLPEKYRKAMRPHRLGYALYQPDLYTRLHPGVLGFLDDNRTWHPLLDLAQTPITDLTKGGAPVPPEKYTPFAAPVPKDPDTRFWGPKVSAKSEETTLSLSGKADALALGLPADVGGAVEYKSRADFGAILMCDDGVVADGFDVREPFLAWLKKNSAALLAEFPDLGRHGVCIATWTYSAASVHINAWEGAGRKVVLGFKAGAAGVGGAGPQLSWSRVSGSGGWSHFVGGEKRVVFFSGVRVNYGLFGPREQAEKKWRGARSDKFLVHRAAAGDDDAAGEDESCVAEVEVFGDDYDDVLK